MNLTNAQAFFGLRANATPSAPNVRNTNEVGVSATGQALFDAVGAYSLRARLMDGDNFELNALTGIATPTISDVPAFIVITGITDPTGFDPLFLTREADLNGKPFWGFENWGVGWNGSDSWFITQDTSVVYTAEKESSANTPIGLTDWTIYEGAGQPTIAARENSTGEIIGGNGLDLYGEDLPTMTDIIGVMVQCTSGNFDISSIAGGEVNTIAAGETRLFVNPNGTGVEYDGFDVICEANDTELEITIIGK
jgi:hypothetical protein